MFIRDSRHHTHFYVRFGVYVSNQIALLSHFSCFDVKVVEPWDTTDGFVYICYTIAKVQNYTNALNMTIQSRYFENLQYTLRNYVFRNVIRLVTASLYMI